MTPAQILDAVSEAISRRQIGFAKNWVITIRNGDIVCVPYTPKRFEGPIIYQLCESTIRSGLSSKQWDHIASKFIAYFSKENQCQEYLKH